MALQPTLAPLYKADAPQAVAARQDERLREAARGFEALFMNELLKSGRSTSFDNDMMESSATRSARSMLDTELADAGAGQAGLGLSEAIYQQFASHVGIKRG